MCYNSRFSRPSVLALVILFFFTLNANAANWYVNDAVSDANDVYTSAPGNDANPGTAAAPFATLTVALTAASAGDVIYVDAGTYLTTVSGAYYDLNKAITIMGPKANVDPRPCAGSARTAGSAGEAIFDGNNLTGAVFYLQSGNVTINGIEIRDATVNSSSRCINSNTSTKDNCIIKYCILGNSRDDAMQLQAITNSAVEYNYIWNTLGAGDAINVCCGSSGVDIQYNEVKNVAGSNGAIYVYGAATDIDIRCNYIHDYYVDGGRMIRIGATGGVSNYSISNNILENGYTLGIQLEQATGTVSGNQISGLKGNAIELKTSANSVTIDKNAVFNNLSNGISVASAVDASTLTVSNNILFDNDGYGIINSNATKTLNAQSNWWGANAGPGGAGGPFPGETYSGLVDATAHLTAMPTASGTALALTYTEASGTPDDGIISSGAQVDFTAPLGYTNYNFKVNGTSVQNGASNTFSSTTLGQPSVVTVEASGNCSGCPLTSNEAPVYIGVVYDPTTLYVDPSGGNCGGNTPCYTALQDALDNSGNGDVIEISAGVINVPGPSFYYEIARELTIRGAQQGVDPRPCAGSTRVSGSAAETIIDGNDWTGAIFYITCPTGNVTIDGLELINVTGDMINSPDANPVKTNINIRNCILHNSDDELIQLRRVSNSVIEYNYAYNTNGDGDCINICCTSDNSIIRYNEVHGSGSTNGSIYVYGPASNISVSCNKVYSPAGSGPLIRFGSSGAGGSTYIIEDNILFGGNGTGIDVQRTGTTVEGNQIFEMTGAGISFSGTGATGSVLNNAIYDNTGNGITLANNVPIASVTINNNLIYNNTGTGLQNQHATLTVNAENNWWGAANGPGGAGPGSGDDISARVDADPFLSAVPTAAGLPPVLAFAENSGIFTNDGIVCSGGSVSFTATSGYTNYNFKINGSSVQSGASNAFVTTALADNDEVTVEVSGHCSGCPVTSDGLLFQVNDLPVFNTASTDETCPAPASGTIIVSNVTGGTPPYQFSKDDGVAYVAGNDQPAAGEHTFSSLTAGDYLVRVKNAEGCVSAALNTTVDLSGFPVLNQTTSTPYCTPEAAMLAASDGDVLVVDAGTYNTALVVDKNIIFEGDGGTVTFTSLTMNGSGKVLTINSDFQINNLTLTAGFIDTNGNNLKAGAITGESVSSYIITH